MTIMSKMRKGATFIEYALLAGLVAIVIAGGAVVFGDKIVSLFNKTGGATDKVGTSVENANLTKSLDKLKQ